MDGGRRLVGLALLLWGGAAARAELEIHGDVVARGLGSRGEAGWLEGGFGRLPTGADGPDDESIRATGWVGVGLDWRSERVGVHLHGVVRSDGGDTGGRGYGLAEGYLWGLFFPRPSDELELRAGTYFLPTSRENVDPLWSSPYTLTLSALNSWIGEEVRPTGVAAEYLLRLGSRDEVRLGAGAYGGNDTAGALLAWQGWSMGDRLSTWGELLPLPPLASLEPGGLFGVQRDDGTRPIGVDLDGRLGWHGHLRWHREGGPLLQVTALDSRGDRRLVEGQYAWATELRHGAAELPVGPVLLAAEWLEGDTGMGPVAAPPAQLDLRAGYLLASLGRGAWRGTLRWDRFRLRDRDRQPTGERSEEDGEAWTAALLWSPTPDLRFGLEGLLLDVERAGRRDLGGGVHDGRQLTLEVRWRF